LTQEIINPEPSTPYISESMVKDIFKTTLDEWKKTRQCENLISVLHATNLSSVKQIVAFACGSIVNTSKQEQMARRTIYQHGLLLTIRNVLNENQSPQNTLGVPIWVQDPAYCAIDTSILAEHGVSTLDDPDGFLKVDDSTMVLSFAPDAPIKQIITEISRPVAMIWNSVTEHEFINEASR
jgi:hypothetical protein